MLAPLPFQVLIQWDFIDLFPIVAGAKRLRTGHPVGTPFGSLLGTRSLKRLIRFSSADCWSSSDNHGTAVSPFDLIRFLDVSVYVYRRPFAQYALLARSTLFPSLWRGHQRRRRWFCSDVATAESDRSLVRSGASAIRLRRRAITGPGTRRPIRLAAPVRPRYRPDGIQIERGWWTRRHR